MKHRTSRFTLGLGLLFFTALPASAQMWYFPDYAVPSANGSPATFIAGTFGTGLNDASGKQNAAGAVIGRTGESVSFMGGLGFVMSDFDNELTVGGSVGLDVIRGGSATVGVQGGIGWMSPGDFTFTRFPIGVSVKGSVETPEASITPWIMPRLNIARVSSDLGSQTDSDLGASAGVSFTFPGGFGVHTALDLIFVQENQPWTFGIGGHYRLGAG